MATPMGSKVRGAVTVVDPFSLKRTAETTQKRSSATITWALFRRTMSSASS